MIRRARREDIPLLMELWQASFGDCMEYISCLLYTSDAADE